MMNGQHPSTERVDAKRPEWLGLQVGQDFASRHHPSSSSAERGYVPLYPSPERREPLTSRIRITVRFLIAMNRQRREGRQTYRDVLGAVGLGRAVADPFMGMGNHRLAGPNLEGAPFVFDAQRAAQDD